MAESNSPKDVKQTVKNNSVLPPHFFVGWDQKVPAQLETSQSTKVIQIFLPQLRGTGDPSTEFHRDPSESPTSKKKPDGHQNPCRNHHGGYKIQHSGGSWERKGEGKTPLEQTDTKSEQTQSLVSSRNSISPSPEKPLAQRREKPRGSRRFQSSGVLLEATLLGQEEW